MADAVKRAREHDGTVIIDFRVQKEDAVFPMVPAGADLDNMIRRPKPVAPILAEGDGEDGWEMPK